MQLEMSGVVEEEDESYICQCRVFAVYILLLRVM